jgi:plastocyanin
MRRSVHALGSFCVLALVLASCASNKATGLPVGPTSPPAGSVCDGTVDMTDQLKFVPENCTVKAGTTVTWKNAGGLPHTVVSETAKQFESEAIGGGGEFTFTFKTAGDFPYFCSVHTTRGTRTPGSMIGTIKVEPA